MSRLVWDAPTERLYETGVKQCVLYPQNASGAYPTGIAWNGITGITESPSGAEASDLYADDAKYVTLMSAEIFGATIEAYMYPPEFAQCDGSATLVEGVTIGQQSRKPFGLAYVTTVGNDSEGNDHGYKIHLIYGAMAKPSERAYSTINDSPEAITFSWELSTTPVNVPGFKPTASLTIDSTLFKTEAAKARLEAFKDVIFGKDPTTEGGTDGIVASLPLPARVAELLAASSTD